jgi:hypothetical protein
VCQYCGATAHRLVDEMSELLRTHWRGEEDGVFTVMSEADPAYAEYVDTLTGEHRSLAAFLDVLDLEVPVHRDRQPW